MDYEQFVGMFYAGMDAIKRGDIDHVDLSRTWENEDGVAEGVAVSMDRDVTGRHEVEKLDVMLAELKEQD